MTWVPWSSRRLAAGTGYGAGVRAPGWYHHLFRHAGPDVVARWFCEVAVVLRAGGHTVSPAQLIDATRLAEALATMRSRPLAGLSEVTDAAAAVLGEGGSAPMALVHEELVVGTRSVPYPPTRRWCRWRATWPSGSAGSGSSRRTATLELDLRRAGGLARSHLLHRLALLEVPWGMPLEGRGAAGTFRETWRLRWEPELSVRLVERSAYGTTVEAAAAAYVVHLAKGEVGLADLTRLVEGCLLADLPAALGGAHAGLADRAAVHADVPQLMDALGPLARARRYGDVRGTDVGALDTVLARPRRADRLRPRSRLHRPRRRRGRGHGAIGSRPPRPRSPCWRRTRPRDEHGQRGHGRARAALVPCARRPAAGPDRSRDGAGTRLPPAARRRAARRGRVRGGCLGRALTPGTPAPEGAAFVEGFLAGSGTVLVHDRELLGLLDEWVASSRPTPSPTPSRCCGGRSPRSSRPSGASSASWCAAAGQVHPATRDLAAGLDEERVRAALATMAALLGVEHGDRR